MKEAVKIQEEIVFSLFRTKHIGKRHTPIKNLCKRLTPISCKDVNKELKVLLKQGIVLPYKTNHGFDVRLNYKEIKKIEIIITERMKKLRGL
ncbi:MAG: hypothetical protein ACRCVG_04120 [Methanobacteriaceae archaeon]